MATLSRRQRPPTCGNDLVPPAGIEPATPALGDRSEELVTAFDLRRLAPPVTAIDPACRWLIARLLPVDLTQLGADAVLFRSSHLISAALAGRPRPSAYHREAPRRLRQPPPDSKDPSLR